ncbi:MAG: hypothetical protein K1X67_24320, partial [Fimbriimonadaceae bacterium]|nr:hypothetical protein [Fimbriimonadaceae bacterium]
GRGWRAGGGRIRAGNRSSVDYKLREGLLCSVSGLSSCPGKFSFCALKQSMTLPSIGSTDWH